MKVIYKIQVNSSVAVEAQLEGALAELKEFLANLILSLSNTDVTVQEVTSVKAKRDGKQKVQSAALDTQRPKHSYIDINKNSQVVVAMQGNIEGFVPTAKEEAKTASQILNLAKNTAAFSNVSWADLEVRNYLRGAKDVLTIKSPNGSYKFYRVVSN